MKMKKYFDDINIIKNWKIQKSGTSAFSSQKKKNIDRDKNCIINLKIVNYINRIFILLIIL